MASKTLMLMRIPFYNIFLDNLSTSELLTDVHRIFENQVSGQIVFFVNAHCFNVAQKNEAYRRALQQADYVLNDGTGIRLASWFQRIGLKENMNGTDLIPKILEYSTRLQARIYLLGGRPGVALEASRNLSRYLPDINIVGARDGFFSPEDNLKILQDITEKQVDILIVGMGVPRQEIWLSQHVEDLPTVRLAVAGGAILDFQAGRVKRAPTWMQKAGMEWFYRLSQEPRRLFMRYLYGNILFFVNLARSQKSN
jgi:N-acetylglucosaminyldiphosphoundecaprenol N-acetyl-beta-D-mannosaminyltransferase